ncbi:MAG: hypothetical protein ABIO71_08490 [Caldimonas sp.]
MSIARFSSAAVLSAALAACGGDVGSGSVGGSNTPPPVTSAPAGLYLGYFQEDAANDPLDPRPGAFTLNLPAVGGALAGRMNFADGTCPASSTATVTGTRTAVDIAAAFTGSVDDATVAGTLAGTFDAATLAFTGGSYAVTDGKQARSVPPCPAYTIAGSGSWELFPVDRNFPLAFTVRVTGRIVSWVPITGASTSLVYVIDPAVAQASGDPMVWQGRVGVALSAAVPSTVNLQTGREYVAAVALADASRMRVAFASQRFTAP